MNFKFILESGTRDTRRKQKYEELYRLMDEAEHMYWTNPRECGILLRKAARVICLVYNERYEIGFDAQADLEEFLCYTSDDEHNVRVSLFLSAARKEQRDRLNKLRVIGDDCVLGEAAPSRGMLLQERMAQNARRMMETMVLAAADMCNHLENSGFTLADMEFREENLPEPPELPPKKKFWEKIFRLNKK